MKRNIIFYSFLLIGIMALSSCGTYVYRATSIKPNFFEEQGDWDAGVNTAIGSAGEVYGTYAISDHIAIGGAIAGTVLRDDSFPFRHSDTNSTINLYNRREAYTEYQLYATLFQKTDNNKVIECQAGVGFNSMSLKFKDDKILAPGGERPLDVRNDLYTRFYIQPAYGVNTRHFDWGLVSRIEYINYKNFEADLLVQPQVFLRYGFRNVKFMTQLGFTTCPIYNSGTLYVQANLGFGVNLTFNGHTKKKQTVPAAGAASE